MKNTWIAPGGAASRRAVRYAALGVLALAAAAPAHRPWLTMEDKGDGTVFVAVGMSDGDSGAGGRVVVRDLGRVGRVFLDRKLEPTNNVARIERQEGRAATQEKPERKTP